VVNCTEHREVRILIRLVILYDDGHSSHITLPFVKFCTDHYIELIALFPNATHLIQPDFKSSWKDSVNDW